MEPEAELFDKLWRCLSSPEFKSKYDEEDEEVKVFILYYYNDRMYIYLKDIKLNCSV